jgi:hypothetical protein
VLSQQPRGQYQKERNIQAQITKDSKQDKHKNKHNKDDDDNNNNNNNSNNC